MWLGPPLSNKFRTQAMHRLAVRETWRARSDHAAAQHSMPQTLTGSVLIGCTAASAHLVDAQAAQDCFPVLWVRRSALCQLLLNAGLKRLQLCMRLACREGQWQPVSCLPSDQ